MDVPATTAIIDGRLIDAITVACGLAVGISKWGIRWWLGKKSPAGKIIMDVLTGSVLIPFGMMVVGVFSAPLYSYTLHSSPGSAALAGLIGLVFVVAELRKL